VVFVVFRGFLVGRQVLKFFLDAVSVTGLGHMGRPTTVSAGFYF
jgi:hypothetical protein